MKQAPLKSNPEKLREFHRRGQVSSAVSLNATKRPESCVDDPQTQRSLGKRRPVSAPVEGYNYSAFCEGIAERDGADCWVRRNVSLPRELLSCDGQLDGHHILKKSWLKREFPHGGFWTNGECTTFGRLDSDPVEATWPDDHMLVTLYDLLTDDRNGLLCCRKHHDLLENARIVIAREQLPAWVEEFAAELGDRALARLECDFGERLTNTRWEAAK